MRGWRLVLTAVVLLAVATPARAGVARVPRRAPCTEWTNVPVPDLGAFQASDVERVSPDEAWIVGNRTPDTIGNPFTFRWDGTQWFRVPFPKLRGGTSLDDVEAVSPDEVWVVGSHGFKRLHARPIAARWDGVRWLRVPIGIDGLTGSLRGLTVIPGTDRLWAVGQTGGSIDGSARPLVLRWNGAAWHRVPTPPIGMRSGLADVTSLGRVAWTVGTRGFPDETRPRSVLILRWSGSMWQEVPTPWGPRRAVDLRAVEAARPAAVWAVGSLRHEGERRGHAVIVRWDGSRWVTARSVDGPSSFFDVHVTSPFEVWAVGSAGRSEHPLIYRRRAGAWKWSPPPDTGGALVAIDGTSNDLWTVLDDLSTPEHDYGWTTSYHRC